MAEEESIEGTENSIPMQLIIGAIIIVIIAVAGAALVLSGGGGGGGEPIAQPENALILDDFDDATHGTNLQTGAGKMSKTGTMEDATFKSIDDKYALDLPIELDQGEWCGYWTFLRSDDTEHSKIYVYIGHGYDVSNHDELKMAVKSEGGSVDFKVEAQDTLAFTSASDASAVFTASRDNPSYATSEYGDTPENLSQDLFGVSIDSITTLSDDTVFNSSGDHNASVYRTAETSWSEVSIPFTEFTGAAPGLHMSDLRQINIVVDEEFTGNLYIDWIAFA